MAVKSIKVFKVALYFLPLVPAFLWALDFSMPKDVTEEELVNVPEEKAEYGDNKRQRQLEEGTLVEETPKEPATATSELADKGELVETDKVIDINDSEIAETDDETGFMEFPLEEPEKEEELETEVAEAPAEGQGRITGQVFDKETGAPVRGVAIAVEGADLGTITDAEGNFQLKEVPEGTYTLEYFKTGYLTANVTDVAVVSGEVKTLDFALPPRPAETSDDVYDLGTITVTAEEANSTMALIDLKQTSVGAVDFLSAEDMARFGGSDISDLVQKITGVNVVEGKFAVVRGLSDRYNSTLVNGLPMPSPDPLRQGLQLDLFPTSIIDNIVTNKIFLPYMPGNSGGGAFELGTKGFSDEPFMKIKVGIRTNDNAQDLFLSTPQSSEGDLLFDFFDSGGKDDRALTPTSVNPSNNASIVDGPLNKFAGVDEDPPLGGYNGSFAISFGDSFKYWGERRVRYVFSSSYDASSKTYIGGSFQNQYVVNSRAETVPRFNTFGTEEIPSFFNGGPRFIAGFPPSATIPENAQGLIDPNYPNNLYATFTPGSLAGDNPFLRPGTVYEDYIVSELSVLGGLLFGLQFDLDEEKNNVITFNTLNSISINDSLTRFGNGSQPIGGADVDIPGGADSNPAGRNEDGTLEKGTVTRDIVRYEERTLNTFQLNGEHSSELDDRILDFDWGLTYAKVESELPLRAESFYFRDQETGVYFIESSSFPSESAFIEESTQFIEQDTKAGRFDFDYRIPGADGRDHVLSTGYYVENVERDASGENLAIIGELEDIDGLSEEELSDNQSNLIASDAFSINGQVYGSEATVTRDTKAIYLMGEFPFLQRFKISGGLRVVELEQTAQGLATLAGTQGASTGNSSDPGQGGFSLEQLLAGTYETLDGTVTNGDILGWTDPNASGLIEENYFLPGFVLQYDITNKLTARFGYSQTFALPSYRELSPYFDFEPATGDTLLGNPFLEPSEVESFDFRIDYDLGNGGFISASVFYKDLENPIERVKLRGVAQFEFVSYLNNDNNAELQGVELELRYNFGFLRHFDDSLEIMENVSFGFNASYIDAVVDRPSEILLTYTTIDNGVEQGPFEDGDPPVERGLYDQPEWLINGDITLDIPNLGTSITASVYAQSAILTNVGVGDAARNQLSTLDEYTKEYYQVDLNIRQKITDNFHVRFKVSNLTDTARGIIYDPDIVEGFERFSYRKGRDYSLSGTYEF